MRAEFNRTMAVSLVLLSVAMVCTLYIKTGFRRKNRPNDRSGISCRSAHPCSCICMRAECKKMRTVGRSRSVSRRRRFFSPHKGFDQDRPRMDRHEIHRGTGRPFRDHEQPADQKDDGPLRGREESPVSDRGSAGTGTAICHNLSGQWFRSVSWRHPPVRRHLSRRGER